MRRSFEILSNAKKIAVVRTDKLGDMVLTLPLCLKIKKEFPDTELLLIARKYVEPLLYGSSAISDCYFIDDFKQGISEIFKQNNLDAAFFPRPRLDEAVAGFRAKIPLRIGSGYRAYSFFFNHRIYEHRKSSELHEVEHNLNLLTSITNKKYIPELVKPRISLQSLENAKVILGSFGFNINDKFILVHPGSGGSAYDWSADNFGSLSKIINQKTGIKIVITGIEQEKEKCGIVEKYCTNSINLCSKINLSELIALISLSKMLIANSTGVLHIAAALDIPVAGFYPNTRHLSQKRWGPYSKKAIIFNPPKIDDKSISDDMSSIHPEDVANEIYLHLSKNFL